MGEGSEKYICTEDELFILGYEPYLKKDELFICHKDSIFGRKYFRKIL